MVDGARPSPGVGQFVLGPAGPAATGLVAHGIEVRVHPSVPAAPIRDRCGTAAGWLLGHGVDGSGHVVDEVVVRSTGRADVEAGLYALGGRWAAVVLTAEAQLTYLDPAGTLAVVYDPERRVAGSTPWLVGGDADRAELARRAVRDFPNAAPNQFHVAALTSLPSVHRLLPNHVLDLATWRAVRHHHLTQPPYLRDDEVEAALDTMAARIRANVLAGITVGVTAYLPLTAGRDSRMVLACTRGQAAALECVTFDYRAVGATRDDAVDLFTARALTSRFGLRLRTVPVAPAGEAEQRRYLERTGYVVGAGKARDFWLACERHLDLDGAWLPAFGGEVGRAPRWSPSDRPSTGLDAAELLRRMHPAHPPGAFLAAVEAWLATAPSGDAHRLSDLAFVELRFGGWASPHFYGTAPFRLQLVPFCHREVFDLMLRLPPAFRRRQALPDAIVARQWPELAELPFQTYPGLRGWALDATRRARRLRRQLGRALRAHRSA